MDTFGSDYDTGLGLYTGSCDSLTEVACNDDAAGGVTSQITVPTEAGATYYILAGGYASDAGNLVLHVNYATPPVFQVAPASLAVGQGSNANFFAVMSGTPPFGFQWSFNGTPLVDDGVHIAGALTGSLTISNLTTADAGTYSRSVTNAVGSAIGSATLTVMTPPVITLQPVGRSVPPGLPTVFTALASGTPAPSYQWRLNRADIAGAVGASYTNAGIGAGDLGFYQVVASNLMGVVTSAPAVDLWAGGGVGKQCL
jgi:hypothetical protein